LLSIGDASNTSLQVILQLGAALEYPNEIVDTPSITCEHDCMLIKVKTSTTNPSHIYADDFAEDEECASRNQNRLTIPLGSCGMKTEKMVT
uniref:ZP domain-containing protein n=1 Tax=Ascaris lumbricoides TaxID=6252 RepID=A0A0M3IG61_ASCLU